MRILEMNANQNLSLWQIGNKHQELFSQLYDPETGEVNMEIQAQLNALEPSIEKKCIALQSWINKLESEERELDALMHQIENRKAAYAAEIEKLDNYLYVNMKSVGIKEIKCPYFKIRIKVNPFSTDILNADEIPKRFIKRTEKMIIAETPDKNAIKEEVLRTGIQVPGAYVYQKEKLQVSFKI
jgi:Siphovirus Gp157